MFPCGSLRDHLQRAHQEVILPFMSMIDDTQLQDKGFEKIPPVLQEGEEKG